MSLILECWEDDLSDAQKKVKDKALLEMKEFQRKIAEVYDMVGNKAKSQTQVAANKNQTLVAANKNQTLVAANKNQTLVAANKNQTLVAANKSQTLVSGSTVSSPIVSTTANQQIFLQASPMNGVNYVLVENNNQFKLVLPNGAIQPQVVAPVVSNGMIRLPTTLPQNHVNVASRANATSSTGGTAKRMTFKSTMVRSMFPPATNTPAKVAQTSTVRANTASVPTPQTLPAASPKSIFIPTPQKKAEPAKKTYPQKLPLWKRPVTKRILNTDIVDLTADDGIDDESNHIGGIVTNQSSKDEPERTFPSLIVVARTFLSQKVLSGAEEKASRNQLDTKVKKILVLAPYNLVEYLFQQKIIKIKQRCKEHDVECQLGLMSEENRTQNSGGFVWVNPCCSPITSVFSGSIFEGAPYPPVTILKLIYHWACQTSVQNVLHWVKVSNVYIKKIYTLLRSICIASIHERFPILGGPNQLVEVGLISLGTGMPAGDNVFKHVKVEVLGVYDVKKRLIRLKALEPMPEADKFKRKKFVRCLQPLREIIHKDSIIITDICAEDRAWGEFGFKKVQASTPNGVHNKYIMNYIRTIVPRMFQNTLSLLSRQLIQQFFDELVWREAWGSVPLTAYNQIIDDIITLTALDSDLPLVKVLIKIAMNPFKDWKFQNWAMNLSSAGTVEKRDRIVNPGEASLFLEVTQGEHERTSSVDHAYTASTSADGKDGMVYLESYYYGSFDSDVRPAKSCSLYTECAICLRDFRDNAQFSDHLIFHALNKVYPVDNPRDICRICLKVPEKGTMNAHVTQFHKDNSNKKNFCKICNVSFKSTPKLVEHMASTHHELELPYTCEICYFRTSIFEDMQCHFSTVHKNMCCAQCPYCLKVVHFLNRHGEDIPKNQMYFIKHIQRHQLPFAKKCKKCALSFHNSAILHDHLKRDHTVCTTSQAIKRYPVVNGQGTLIQRPVAMSQAPDEFDEHEDEMFFLDLGLIQGLIEPSNHPVIGSNLSFFRCKECDGPLTKNHLTLEPLKCSYCHFCTNCLYNYSEHVILSHSDIEAVKSIQWYKKSSNSSPRTSKPYHCTSCLFSTSDGNELVHHLVTVCPDAFSTTDKRKAQYSCGYYNEAKERKEDDAPSRKRKSQGSSSSGSRKKRRPNSVISDESDNSSTASVYQESLPDNSSTHD